MKRHMQLWTVWVVVFFFAMLTTPVLAQEDEVALTDLGNYGPTGLEVSILNTGMLQVTKVQPDSPAVGKFQEGDTITQIDGKLPCDNDDKALFARENRLASFIIQAEEGDGAMNFTVRGPGQSTPRREQIKLAFTGKYDKDKPYNSELIRKIVRANADFIAAQAGSNGENFTEHNLYNGWAILMLLSTGEQKDLDVVRKVYHTRMANFTDTDTGSHTWHNGLQGIAVCEYYLRTGDKTVMPLINAICESARKYEVDGGWSHWAKGINPQYTAGGLMNAAGTQLLTTMLLAQQCGAKVDQQALLNSVKFFYRFAGHGNNPYGDHRPEGGFGSDNGKTEMLALAMNAASRAEDGKVYAMARDKSAQTALYDYPYILHGHTGPHGLLWYGIAAALMADKEPRLYANWVAQTRWFYVMSLHADGSFGACEGGRYDDQKFAYAIGLAYTAPLKTLRITGAPKSPYAQSFMLMPQPWGRESDLAFLSTRGGPAYRGSNDPPHIELGKIATADEPGLISAAAHPEHSYREIVARTLQDRHLHGLIEKLLESDDPLTRTTACMAINGYEPWGLRFSIGTRARYSLAPDQFTQRMFDDLMKIINDPNQPLWVVNKALLACAAASPDQIKSHMDDIIPWLHHGEWWLNESACIALTPAMKDPVALNRILPDLIDSLATNMHARPRDTMNWMMKRAVADAGDDVKNMMTNAFIKIYGETPSVPNPEPGVDWSGITSCALLGTLNNILTGDQEATLQAAELSAKRIDEMRPGELGKQITALIESGENLDAAGQKKIGQILVKYYRPLVVGDDPAKLKEQMATGTGALDQLNKLLSIDRMAGRPGGWRMFGNNDAGQQEWWTTSFDPHNKPYDSEMTRYRQVDPPQRLAGWFKPDYDPAAHGWTHMTGSMFDVTPTWYPHAGSWVQKAVPDEGEVVFVRKTFELKDMDYPVIRLSVYSRQGYEVYLNGKLIERQKGRSKNWGARRTYFNEQLRKNLKVGTNVITAMSFLQYFKGKDGGLDLYIEGLHELPSVEK